MPPPALPHPPARELAVPTIFLSKNPVHHTWQGTNVPPKMPTKNRSAIRPCALVTRPAMAVGRDPQRSSPTKTRRGPNRSHNGPATNLTRSLGEVSDISLLYTPGGKGKAYVARRATMFEFATCAGVMLRSFLIVALSCEFCQLLMRYFVRWTCR